MRRIAGFLCVLGAAGGLALVAAPPGASDDGSGRVFKVELDNAFGLIEGGDFKVAGVRAGKITKLDLDRRTKRAIVSFEITRRGFGSLRADTRCEVAPQSLVGEYFVDCDPGRDRRRLEPGSTIPVERTSTTVPPDLVNNLLRRPYRERLSFIVNELGAAVAGNGENLNAALRRASPALRETNRVLAILARQNQTIADLTRDADQVVGELADNRRDVARWVDEARGTARASAERDRDIAAGFERLPGFLRELRPTMTELGRTVDEQGPAVRNLAASSGQLERLFRNLPPFARASRPAIDSLGEASKTGREAMRKARSTVAELDRYGSGAPELSKNLAITLEHLDDRRHSAEEDPRSPGGEGYTGLEALLQYVFDQTLSTNVHDGNVHILKVFPFEGECAPYADIAAAKELGRHCSTALGPNSIGINFPDATAPAGYDGRDRAEPGGEPSPGGGRAVPIPVKRTGPRPGDGAFGSSSPDGAHAPEARAPEARPDEPPAVAPGLPELPPVPSPPPSLRDPLPGRDDRSPQDQLLDYLLGS